MLREPNEPLDRVEYFGPIEIVEPEPEPVPLAGCVTWIYKDHRNSDMVHCCCSQIDGVSIIDCRGHTRREAIERHNAAVKAIMELAAK